MVSLTDTCNIKCLTCWRLDKEEDPNTWRTSELTFEEIRSLLGEAKEMGVEVVDFTGGGEPFTRREVFEIIEMIKGHGFFGTLTSNGTLTNEARVRRLIELGLDDICFSIETLDEALNDRIRGEGVTQKVIRSVETVNALKGEMSSKLPHLRLGTVVTAWNYAHLESLVPFAATHQVEAINFSLMLEWESNKELSLRRVDEGEVLGHLEKVRALAEREGIYCNLPSILRHGLGEHELPRFCFAPWEMAFVNSRGEVLACCILASFYENVLGNIRDNGFKALWYGEKMERFRARLGEGRFYPDCRRCLPEFVDIFNGRLDELKGRR